MARHALIPPALTLGPFRAADAIASGLLTRNRLRSAAWRRLYQGIYADATLPVDHRLLCQAAGLLLPPGGAVGFSAPRTSWASAVSTPDPRSPFSLHRPSPLKPVWLYAERSCRPTTSPRCSAYR